MIKVREITGNLWDFHLNSMVVIPTNGVVTNKGALVMGRGVALQAKKIFPGLPSKLGHLVRKYGNKVHICDGYNIISFPVKHNWRERADLQLIRESTSQLSKVIGHGPIYLPMVGCGSGGLEWKQVRPILEQLDNRFVVVRYSGNE